MGQVCVKNFHKGYISFGPPNTLRGGTHHSHFVDGNMEAQNGEWTCPRSPAKLDIVPAPLPHSITMQNCLICKTEDTSRCSTLTPTPWQSSALTSNLQVFPTTLFPCLLVMETPSTETDFKGLTENAPQKREGEILIFLK